MHTLTKYVAGFVLSLVLTAAAFGLVLWQGTFGDAIQGVIVPLLIVLALAQLFVQLTLFLHMGDEEHPRWNLSALVLAVIIVLILVGGTLWIMQNLSHGQMQHEPDVFVEENIFPQ